ncbi:MAG: 2-C-methyl-D-erythritol 4-phosphate cytidylyltransferase [Actinomycetota bacterium]
MDSGSTPSAAPAAVVVLAGGIGSRMQAGAEPSPNASSSPRATTGGADAEATGPRRDHSTSHSINKVYLAVGGREVLAYSLAAIDASDAVGLVVLVVRDGDQDHAADLLRRAVTRHPTRITVGGASRHESERAGIEAVADDVARGEIGVVAVHDGARPFLTTRLLDDVLRAAATTGGAIAALPVSDMLYHRDDERFVAPAGYAWAQTPQAFDGAGLLAAHRRSGEAGVEGVDTAQVLERFGDQSVTVVEGDPANIKLTFRHDLASAETLAASPPPSTDQSPAAEGRRPRAATGTWGPPNGSVAHCHVAETDTAATTIWLSAGTLRRELAALGPGVTTVVFHRGEPAAAPPTGDRAEPGADPGDVAPPDGADATAFYRAPSSALKWTESGVIVRSVDRTLLRALCGPEVVDRQALAAALAAADPDAVVNPASAVAAAGGRVLVVEAT